MKKIIKIKAYPKKRQVWGINPVERIHGKPKGYDRKAGKNVNTYE